MFKYRMRYLGVDMWEAPHRWSQTYVIAANDEDAYSFFDVHGGDKPFYELMRKPYRGSLAAGTKRRISW